MSIKTNFKANASLAKCDRVIKALELEEQRERGLAGSQALLSGYVKEYMPQDALDEYARVNKSTNAFKDLEEISDPEVSMRDVEDHVCNRLSGSTEVLNNRYAWFREVRAKWYKCWTKEALYAFVSELARADAMYNSAMQEIYGDKYDINKAFDSSSLFDIERREDSIKKQRQFRIDNFLILVAKKLDRASTMHHVYTVVNDTIEFDKTYGTDTFGMIRWHFFNAETRIRAEIKQARAVATAQFKPCIVRKGAASELVDRPGRYQQLIAQGWAKG